MPNKPLALLQLTRLDEYYGLTLALTVLGGVFNPLQLDLLQLGRLFIVSLLLMAFAFAINDIEDAPDDAQDKAKQKRNPISARRLGLSEARVFTLLLALAALILSGRLGNNALYLTIAGLMLGFLYSFKGVRLKSMPVLDLLSHGLFLAVIQFLLAGLAFGAPWSFPLLAAALGIYGISILGDIRNELRDFEVDRATGIRNTASVFNLKPLEPYLERIYVIPGVILAYSLIQFLPQNRQFWAIGLSLLVAALFILMPARWRVSLIREWAQPLTLLASVAAYAIFY
jgi:4-hydroxybenzoate polyprenyltransferase